MTEAERYLSRQRETDHQKATPRDFVPPQTLAREYLSDTERSARSQKVDLGPRQDCPAANNVIRILAVVVFLALSAAGVYFAKVRRPPIAVVGYSLGFAAIGVGRVLWLAGRRS